MKTIEQMRTIIENKKARSAWNRGVKEYALELLDNIYNPDEQLENIQLLDKALLNGADNWKHYSWSGCALCYDGQIARRLCTPSELKRTDNGRKQPNKSEQWLDVQARALYQASALIRLAYRGFKNI